jgi:hypothetical protein
MIAFLQEYALLIAVALPPTIVVAINVYLALRGERGTLLLPTQRPFDDVHACADMLLDRRERADLEAIAAQEALRRAA